MSESKIGIRLRNVTKASDEPVTKNEVREAVKALGNLSQADADKVKSPDLHVTDQDKAK